MRGTSCRTRENPTNRDAHHTRGVSVFTSATSALPQKSPRWLAEWSVRLTSMETEMRNAENTSENRELTQDELMSVTGGDYNLLLSLGRSTYFHLTVAGLAQSRQWRLRPQPQWRLMAFGMAPPSDDRARQRRRTTHAKTKGGFRPSFSTTITTTRRRREETLRRGAFHGDAHQRRTGAKAANRRTRTHHHDKTFHTSERHPTTRTSTNTTHRHNEHTTNAQPGPQPAPSGAGFSANRTGTSTARPRQAG